MRVIFSLILIVIGAAVTYFSWWLLIHSSDEKVRRLIRSDFTPRMSKEEEDAYLGFNVAFVGAIIMVMGSLLLLAGVASLFGVGWS